MLTAGDLAQLSHLLRPLRVQVANLAARATVQLVDDSGQMQTLQIGDIAGGPYPGAEHVQPYGFSSVPLTSADTAVVIFPNGDRAHPLVIVVADRRYRPTGGQPGEVTVYNHTGAKIVLTKDGDIVATPAPGRKILAGGVGATTPPALSSELANLKARIAAWTPVANDGGASLKTVIAAWPVPGATKIDVE
jgi:phage baseplate assembly protein V